MERNENYPNLKDFKTANVKRQGGVYFKRTANGWVECSEVEAKRVYINSEMGYSPEEWFAKHRPVSDEERRRVSEKLWNNPPQPGNGE